jgi:4-oxalocrotonate tautomerase
MVASRRREHVMPAGPAAGRLARGRPHAGERSSEAMPELTIEMVEGRTLEQKRELVRRLTEVVVDVCKVDPSAVTIVIHENRREDKAKGGVLFLDR